MFLQIQGLKWELLNASKDGGQMTGGSSGREAKTKNNLYVISLITSTKFLI